MEGSGTVEQTAFCLHAPIHRHNKQAKAVLHSHTPYTTALCLIEGGRVEPANMPGFQFSGKIAYDEDCQGGALSTSEGDREAAILADKQILMMRNHGPIVVGPTIAAAFDRLYYLEEICKRQVLAMSTNRRLPVWFLTASFDSCRRRTNLSVAYANEPCRDPAHFLGPRRTRLSVGPLIP